MNTSEHQALVRAIERGRVQLELDRQSLPVSFRSASILPCASSEKVLIDLPCTDRMCEPQKHVTVILEERRRPATSFFWFFVCPLLFWGCVYAGVFFLTKTVTTALAGAVIFVLPYYSFLWILKDTWNRDFVFRIKS